jgi:2-aminoadipate transaminase
MDSIFSDRIADVPKSFVREILKTTQDDSIISFAGGLPNRALFPIEAIKSATIKVLDESGGDALQYSTTEGFLALREWIAERYLAKQGIMVDADNILITNGSQQGLDLIGKTILNDGDPMAIEEPGYLGAIQAFSMYRPQFHPIPLHFDGLDIASLKACMKNHALKLLYTVPNFQNPSGISHSDANRDATADSIRHTPTLLIEDDPYGELQFSGARKRSFFKRIPENTILLGSFSKIFVPSFRIGWIVAPHAMLDKLVIAKQAADLHTNYFAQRILYQYLCDNSIDEHIEKIRATYSRQRDAMVRAIGDYFPSEVNHSEPEGGMFLWAILPEGISAKKVFDAAIKEKIAFVPGDPFYVNKTDVNTMRLNFSCVDEQTIKVGIEKLGNVVKKFMERAL